MARDALNSKYDTIINYGYADESGEPGVGKNDHDYFVFCIIIINNLAEANKISDKIQKLKDDLKLPSNYEFHYIDNSKKVRAAFMDLIGRLDFRYIDVYIKKNNYRNYASVKNLSSLVLESLEKNSLNLSLEMDKNPSLYKEIRKQKKNYDIVLHCSEKESRGNNMIQLADYVTAIRTHYLKNSTKKDNRNAYLKIIKKRIDAE